MQLSLTHEGWPVVNRIIDTLLPRPQRGAYRRGLPPLRYVTLVPHGEINGPAHELRFARVSAVFAIVPTLERCTLDLRKVRNAPGRLEQHKAWLREHMAELHAKGVLHFVV